MKVPDDVHRITKCVCGGSSVDYEVTTYRRLQQREFLHTVHPFFQWYTVAMTIIIVVSACVIVYVTLAKHEKNGPLWVSVMMILFCLSLWWFLMFWYYVMHLPPELRLSLMTVVNLNLFNTAWGNFGIIVCSIAHWELDDMLALYGILCAPTLIALAYAGVESMWYIDRGMFVRDFKVYYIFRCLPLQPKEATGHVA